MSGWIESIRSWPWVWAWLTFFVIVLLRAGSTYAIGRAVTAGVLRRREPGPRTLVAMRQVERWGPPAVTASFLTVGAQTAVNFAAGLGRMTVGRYLTVLVPGAAVWATIWSTIGISAVYAVFTGGAERAAWLLALLAAAVVALLLARAVRSRD